MSFNKGGKDGGVTSVEPWGPQQDPMKKGYGVAGDMLDNSSLYTPLNPRQRQGQQMGLGYADQIQNRFLSPYQNWSQTMLERPGIDDNPYNTNTSMQNVLHPDAAGHLGVGKAITRDINQPGASDNPFGINAAIQQGLNAPNVNSNPYLEQFAQAATRPLEQQLNLQTNPGIRSQFGMSQPGGGSRQGVAEGVARGLTNQAIGDTRANIFSNAYGQGLNQQTNALGAANQAYGIGTNREMNAIGAANQNYGMGAQTQLGGIGAANQAYGQGLDAQSKAMALYPEMLKAGTMPADIYSQIGGQDYADEHNAQTAPWEKLSAYQGIINGNGNYNQQSGGGSGQSPLLGGLGGAATGAGLGNLLSSGAGGPWGALLGGLIGLLG